MNLPLPDLSNTMRQLPQLSQGYEVCVPLDLELRSIMSTRVYHYPSS
jgi:hypothetical protein